MPPSAPSPISALERWRQKLRTRLRAACLQLGKEESLNSTAYTHVQDFKKHLKSDVNFASEVRKLSKLEFEILAISSTLSQLTDSQYFTALEVSDVFVLDIREDRRHIREERRLEVRNLLCGVKVDASVKNAYDAVCERNEANLLEYTLRVVMLTLSRSSAQRLCEMLRAKTNCTSRSWPGPNSAYATDTAQHESSTLIAKPCAVLSGDANSLLHIMHAAGGKIPECFSLRASAWDQKGILMPVQVPAMPVVADPDRYRVALEELLRQGTVQMSDNKGLLVVRPEVATQLHITSYWKLAALEAVTRAFPRYPDQAPCSATAVAMIQPLATVLSYIYEVKITEELQVALAAVCLSASFFGLLPWKRYMLELADVLGSIDTSLRPRLHLRYIMLARLEGKQPSPEEAITIRQHILNRRDNALLGEEILFQLKVLQAADAPLQQLEACRNQFQVLPPANEISIPERRVVIRADAVIAKTSRNYGLFLEASQIYNSIMKQHLPAESTLSVGYDVFANMAETFCELGQPDKAIQMLQSEVYFAGKAITRLHLALGNAWLMKSLFRFYQYGEIDIQSLEEARDWYKQYLEIWRPRGAAGLTKIIKEHRYLALAGFAMALHLPLLNPTHPSDTMGFQSNQDRGALMDVLHAWRHTRDAAQGCWPSEGFAAMVTYYAESEVAHRFPHSNALAINTMARNIAQRTDRQCHFVAQGTIWLDILDHYSPKQISLLGIWSRHPPLSNVAATSC